MILHIPHSSIDTKNIRFDCDLEQELYRMTDIDTDKLFSYSNSTRIILPVSRLICDVERFEDDNLEVMASKGMGVCYITNSFGGKLRDVAESERADIINKYYKPHHQSLSDAVDAELKEKGSTLLIDCHSFSNIPLPHEDSQITPRPDICIGTDSFHTPQSLIDVTVDYFKKCGYTVQINDPFAGTLIPMKHYQTDKRVSGIMIELNRDLYKNNFQAVKQNISKFLEAL